MLADITVALGLALAIWSRPSGISTIAGVLLGACIALLAVPVLPPLRSLVHKLREPYRASQLFEWKKRMKQNEHRVLAREREDTVFGEL